MGVSSVFLGILPFSPHLLIGPSHMTYMYASQFNYFDVLSSFVYSSILLHSFVVYSSCCSKVVTDTENIYLSNKPIDQR